MALDGLAVMGWSGLQVAGKAIALDVCTRLAETVPSLQYVGLVWFKRTYAPLEPSRVIVSSIWYKVPPRRDTKTSPVLVRLPDWEGDIVFAELLASRA